jgi:hypothetical protein
MQNDFVGTSPATVQDRQRSVTLDRAPTEDDTGHMEAVGIALVAFGPLVVILLLLIKATRKLMRSERHSRLGASKTMIRHVLVRPRVIVSRAGL